MSDAPRDRTEDIETRSREPGPAGRPRHVVVLGAGFGGLEVCRRLARSGVRITVVDRQNHHLFQPLLYQVATSGLAAPEIAEPIRSILRRDDNVTVLMDEATAVEPGPRRVELRRHPPLSYDRLVLATGAVTSYFGNDEWARHAPGLKTLADALAIRASVLRAFEDAEHETDPARRSALMRIVVVGGGPMGVELAGSLAELLRHVLQRDFRNIDPSDAEIVLLEVAPRLLGPFSERLSALAKRQLEELGVEVRLDQEILRIDEVGVELDGERLPAANVLWGAGVQATPIAGSLGVCQDRRGRIEVGPDLTVPGWPDVYVVGDVAHAVDGRGEEVPGVAPAAIQMGRYVAERIAAEVRGEPQGAGRGAGGESERARVASPFTYRDRGMMATLGRSKAGAAGSRPMDALRRGASRSRPPFGRAGSCR